MNAPTEVCGVQIARAENPNVTTWNAAYICHRPRGHNGTHEPHTALRA